MRIHTGQGAAESTSAINALAYTVGDNVVFGAGQYRPHSHDGKRLLAHELTHTLQQKRGLARKIQRVCPVLNAGAVTAAATAGGGWELPRTLVDLTQTGPDGQGHIVKASPLTRLPGNTVGSEPDNSVYRQQFDALTAAGEGGYWVRAHLLHGRTSSSGDRHLHGPGTKNNLIITDKSLNGQMRTQVEDCALRFVHDQSRALWYETTVNAYYPGQEYFAQSLTVRYGLYNLDTRSEEPALDSKTFTNVRTPPGSVAAAGAGSAMTASYDVRTSAGNAVVPGPARTPTGRQEIPLENTPAQNAIPGLSLKKMILGSEAEVRNNRKDTLEAAIAIQNAPAANPIIQQLGAPGAVVRLKREVSGTNAGTISIDPGQRLSLHPPYLSEAWIDNLRLENGVVSGAGGLRPSLPILNSRPMQLEFGPDRMRVFYGAAQRNVAQRSNFIRITQCTLGVDILPELRPVGELAFAMGPSGRDLLTGQVTASADLNGIMFDGSLLAHIPGTDEARGEAHYRGGRWNGFVVVNSSKIRLPGFQQGEVRVDFSSNEQGDLSIVPSGRVDLLVANQPVTLEALYRNHQFFFIGRGRFNLPGLNPIDARIETDGTQVNMEARTGIAVRDLTGDVALRYRNGRWSGDGTATINKGRAQGTANVHLSERGRLYGDGRISYRFTDNLTASMGIVMNEDRRIRVSGDITLATIRLFERFPQGGAGRRRLFRTHFSVPILGFTLGPLGDIGLVLAIDPELGVYYGIGPGELRNARITTAFDPMADDPNFEFTAGAQLNIPFDAGFYLTIPASLSVGAVVGSVSAGLSATADVGLRGNFDAQAQMAYRQQRWSVDALAGIYANPRLALRIEGFLRAEALRGTYEREKRWNLREWEWGSNMRFGVEFPFRYASDQPFQAPSFENIRFIYPQNIDFRAMLRDIAGQAR